MAFHAFLISTHTFRLNGGDMKTVALAMAVLVGGGTVDALAQQRAQPVSDSGFYILGSVGRAWADINNAAIDESVRSAGFATSSTTSDDDVSAWKLALGYQIGRNFALELAYAHFDNFNLTTTTTGPAATFNGNIDGKAYSLDLIGILPVSSNVDLFAKVGAHHWDVDTRLAAVAGGATVGTASGSADGTDWKFGVGARWNFSRNLGLQLEWERYNDVGDANVTGKSDIDMVTVGLRWKF
jgi:OOP family OmpA-OmpF porin